MSRSLILCLIGLTACNEGHSRSSGSAADSGVESDAGSCGAPESFFVTTYPDGGPCDDSPTVHSESWRGHRGAYVVTCETQAAGARGCKGIPNDLWGRCSLRRCESTETYPMGCTLYMPSENPHYPGSPQACSCQVVPGSTDPAWSCGL